MPFLVLSDTHDVTSTPVGELDQLPHVISKLDELELKNEAAEQQETHAHEEPGNYFWITNSQPTRFL